MIIFTIRARGKRIRAAAETDGLTRSPALCTLSTDKRGSWPCVAWIKSKGKHSPLHAETRDTTAAARGMEEWLLCFPSWADIIKSGDNHCLLLLLACVSALSLFLRFCKWGAVYCLGCNRVHPLSCFFLFLLFFLCIVNCSFLLCGQPVQFIDSVYTVFSKVNVRWNTDNSSKYHRLVWWHLVDVFLFSSNLRTDNCPVFFVPPWATVHGNHWSMWTHSNIPRCTGNGVMGFFPDSINMTGVFKRQRVSLRLHVHFISAVWPSRLRPGCLASSPPVTMRSQWTLHFPQSFAQTHSSAWHSPKKTPEGLCNLFQVNALTFERNASKEQSEQF